jgi:hypothetical protein
MKPEQGIPGIGYLRTLFAATVLAPGLLITTNVNAETNVYRCTSPSGAVEFRQLPCADGSDEQELVIEDRKTGWKPTAAGVGGTRKNSSKQSKRKRNAESKVGASRAGRTEQCWKKQQLLEEVNSKLRRGYKAQQGIKLRRKRRAYEDYISRFCD